MEYTARELERLIKKAGWKCVDQKGSHRHYKHADLPGKVSIPFHKPDSLKIRTAKQILKTAGLLEEEK